MRFAFLPYVHAGCGEVGEVQVAGFQGGGVGAVQGDGAT